LTALSIGAGRSPLVDCNRLADSQIANYKSKIERNVPIAGETNWLAHPVQKEAIQNSADAFESSSNDKWCVTFEMDDRLPPRYIAITDQGTCGLTGKALIAKEELDKLQKESPGEYQKERWAKFEALSYPNIDPVGRGSRGQGKWVFIGASETKTIFYDTLRQDGVYRVGAWLGENQLLKEPPDGEHAEKLLKQNFPYLDPLRKVGTRVIIVNPKKELWEGFTSLLDSAQCQLRKYIAETWWELLKKGTEILIKWKGETIKVEPPLYYTDSFIQNQTKEEWSVRNVFLGWYKNPEAKVSELVIIYSEKVIPEEFRGIAIQRAQMKINNFDISTVIPSLSPEIADHLYGWITFNQVAEEELREAEDPTHYDYSASLGTFGYHVFGKNGWLSQQIMEFAEKKLGLGLDKSKIDHLDTIATRELNKFVNKYRLGLPLEKSPHPTAASITKTAPTIPEIRVKLPKPLLPREETRRVEYGEAIKNIRVSVANDSNVSRKVKLTLVLKAAFRKVQERVLKTFVDCEITVNSQSESTSFGPYSVTFDKEKFDSGTYALEAEIVLLDGDVSAEEFPKGWIDDDRELIYVNTDPPPGEGLFEPIERVEFKQDKELQFRLKPKEGKMKIQINVLHPAYRYNENLDDLLAKKKLLMQYRIRRPLMQYELSVGAEAIAQFDIKKDAKLLSKGRKQFVEKCKEDEKAFFIEAIDVASHVAQRIRNEIL